jgi:hypothetical protein
MFPSEVEDFRIDIEVAMDLGLADQRLIAGRLPRYYASFRSSR